MLQQNNRNDYMLIQDQKSMADDNMSIASTLAPTHQSHHTDKGFNSVTRSPSTGSSCDRSSSINSLCRRISTSIRRNFQDNGKSRRETRREKRPQDGKTNPME